MKLIVGLGNPGEKYAQNRHNVGFMFLNYLLETLKIRRESESMNSQPIVFKKDKYLFSEVAQVGNLFLAKPQTFMNKSGDAVKKISTHYKIQTAKDLIVIHDDLDIPFGKFKIQKQGPKQHNGITDIQNKLMTMDFLRIRIGVDNRPSENRMNGEEYVLQNFIEQETSLLPELFKKIDERFKPFLQAKISDI